MSYSSRVARAIGPVFESMEPRQLFHGGAAFDLHVNFQPATAAAPAGYLVDGGSAFADRGNGFSYGWDATNTVGARERNTNADQRYDTFNHLQAYGTRKWEAAVPNGNYTVRVVAGDPGYFNSVYKLNVEGVLTVNGTPTSGNRFIEGTQTVTVTDGRLTISNAEGASNNKIAFVEIASAGEVLPTVSLAVLDPSAFEAGPKSGSIVFTRTGDLDEPLIVKYSLGGTATNGIDYVQLLGAVTIPANSASAIVSIDPIDDTATESGEIVIATLIADVDYSLAAEKTATVTIADNDAAAFSAKINFQPAAAPAYVGYLIDGGLVYTNRNGLSYGWSSDNAGAARDRNGTRSADQRYDTFVHTSGKTWEIAVPNGMYSVHAVSGDPNYFDSVYQIDAEGVRVVNGTPTTAARWIEGTMTVNVTDGKLTIVAGGGAVNNKINFIEITSLGAVAALPSLAVSAPTTNASENGTSRAFTITRSGPIDLPLTVYYTIGGSATNGVDYATIVSPITIPAGSASAAVTVSPIDDAYIEATETVTLTLSSQSAYTLAAESAATIRINDNDTPIGNTIAWSTKAVAPIIRAEALRAVVDGKLYVFGGFMGEDGPVKRSDVYDPATSTWTQITDLPKRITHAPLAVDGRNIYMAGGYIGKYATGYDQIFGTKEVWKFNVDTQQWTAVAALPKALASGGLVVLGRELHYFSGNDSTRSDVGDHYVLNLDAPTNWVAAAALPEGRSHLGFVALNGKIYALGGQKGNDELLTTQKFVHVWDPANPSVWTRLADMPIAISHISSSTFVFGNRIVIAGGETAHGAATDLVYAYDPATNTFAAMTKLPAKRFSGVAAEIAGAIYFTGGSSMTTTWKGVVS